MIPLYISITLYQHEHYRSFVQHQQCTLLVFLWKCEFELDWPQFLGSCDFRERTTCFLVLISTVLPLTGTEISGLINHQLELRTTTISWIYAVSHTEGLLRHIMSPCVWFSSIVSLKTLSWALLLWLDPYALTSTVFCLDHFQQKIWVIWLDQPRNRTQIKLNFLNLCSFTQLGPGRPSGGIA